MSMVLAHTLDSLVEGEPGVIGHCAQARARPHRCGFEVTVHVLAHSVQPPLACAI